MSDGIPMFRDKYSRSVIPVLLRSANMGDHLSMKFRYTHLTGLVPSHFWMLRWEDGEVVEDYSKHASDPARRFRLRAALLYWCGDYPGQGEASGFSHAPGGKKACHWCEVLGTRSMAIDRQQYADYYRSTHLHLCILHSTCFRIFRTSVYIPGFFIHILFILGFSVYFSILCICDMNYLGFSAYV